ncbi:MAG TPA: FRG domain-containing protein, partial [Fimbriimonadaceae bacterium]|nr:FRG domain-containing protein [Fimbriimonadaceae bacterium]
MPHRREQVVRTLGELVDMATPTEPDEESGRLRAPLVFRGGRSNWGLLTSLDRLGEKPHKKAKLEEHILRNFQRYSRPYLPSGEMSHWEMLVVARHHGLPTRLLDWSYSPLVAAHFATLKERPEHDRVVWQLDFRRVHEHFGIKPVSLLVEDVDELLSERGTNLKDLLDGRMPSEVRFACLFEPPALDARLVSQSAC